MAEQEPFEITPDGITLHIRVTPRASRTSPTGIVTDTAGRPAIALRLAAPPVDGAANEALLTYLAKTLTLRRTAITLTAGQTTRQKRLHLTGAPADLAARVRAWLAAI
jgi:hypothetical protein